MMVYDEPLTTRDWRVLRITSVLFGIAMAVGSADTYARIFIDRSVVTHALVLRYHSKVGVVSLTIRPPIRQLGTDDSAG